ncbi:MAG TPA: RNA methyltransferase [Aestuariivirgaceae bacterium]|nr:RNA methyltransferase [Aestuariivirgaceae bacterium]
MDHIESAQNPTVKLLRSLASRKGREQEGLFVAEGVQMATKARAHDFTPRFVLVERGAETAPGVADIMAWAGDQGARVASVTAGLMSRLTGKDNPQPVLLACAIRQADLPGPAATSKGTSLALAGIRDPGNLGTIIRTAEATGVERVILVGPSCDAFAPEAVRASTGSIFAIPIVMAETESFASWAGAWPGDRIGLDATTRDTYRRSYRRPVLVMLGSESGGLPPELRHLCTRLVRIPMRPGVESLNVAAATAVMLYELDGGAIEPGGPTGS